MTDSAPWLGRDALGPLTPVDDGRSDAPATSGVHNLAAEAQAALEQARRSRHGKGTRVLWAGQHQRVVVARPPRRGLSGTRHRHPTE